MEYARDLLKAGILFGVLVLSALGGLEIAIRIDTWIRGRRR